MNSFEASNTHDVESFWGCDSCVCKVNIYDILIGIRNKTDEKFEHELINIENNDSYLIIKNGNAYVKIL